MHLISCWCLETGHGGSIFIRDISKDYKFLLNLPQLRISVELLPELPAPLTTVSKEAVELHFQTQWLKKTPPRREHLRKANVN